MNLKISRLSFYICMRRNFEIMNLRVYCGKEFSKAVGFSCFQPKIISTKTEHRMFTLR